MPGVDTEPRASTEEQRPDLIGLVSEEVTGILVGLTPDNDAICYPAAIGVNESPHEEVRTHLEREASLPRVKPDLSKVLRARAVLRKEARPVH